MYPILPSERKHYSMVRRLQEVRELLPVHDRKSIDAIEAYFAQHRTLPTAVHLRGKALLAAAKAIERARPAA